MCVVTYLAIDSDSTEADCHNDDDEDCVPYSSIDVRVPVCDKRRGSAEFSGSSDGHHIPYILNQRTQSLPIAQADRKVLTVIPPCRHSEGWLNKLCGVPDEATRYRHKRGHFAGGQGHRGGQQTHQGVTKKRPHWTSDGQRLTRGQKQAHALEISNRSACVWEEDCRRRLTIMPARPIILM